MSKILWLLFPVIVVSGEYRYGCDPAICTRTECRQCNVGHRLLPNASQCGCCPLCIEQLKEGEKCETREFMPTKECGARLQCDKALCLPAKTKCVRAESEGKDIRPECNEFGFYKPVQCINSVMCYCVNKEGKRIFGTDTASRSAKMKCDCSREYEEFHRNTASHLRCTSNGNYDDLQCTEKWCYCMANGEYTTKENIKNLLCYQKKEEGCRRERESLLRQIAEEEGTVIGVDLPDCDLDGSYAPLQCAKGSCFCVKKSGEQYGRTKYKRNLAKIMEYCRCLREAEMLESSKNIKKVGEFLQKNDCKSKEDQI